MSRYTLIFIILLLIFSCKEKIPEGFYVSKYDKYGNVIEISKNIKDTLIENKKFILKYKKVFDSEGNLLNKGNYIENYKIGKHYFYKNGFLIKIKYFTFFNEDDVSFLLATKLFGDTILEHNKTDTSYLTKYGDTIIKPNKIYLNGEVFFSKYGDTIFEKSTFLDLRIKNERIKLQDTLFINITAYNSSSKVDAMNLYLYDPANNKYMIVIHTNHNNFLFKQKAIKDNIILKGFAIIKVSEIENKSDTVYYNEVYKINKKFTVY